MKKKLYIVHCIDTEGPLYESIDATFERLRAVFGVDISATKENLRKIQKQEVNLGNKSKEIAKSFSKHLLAYNDTWDKIDPMLDKIMTNEYSLMDVDESKYKNNIKESVMFNKVEW